MAWTDEGLDLFVRLRRGSTDGETFILRLRYCTDWKVAGRRESFVNPDNFAKAGREWWPREVSGINPDHNPTPAICLPGCWGFHSVLHTDRRDVTEHTLNEILRNLQTMMR
jgi:hypothetical protein